MSHRNLIRWCGLAAVLAGILRGIASFTPTAASVALQVFYFAIDVLLLLGTIGVYEFQKKKTGRWGFSGFLLALIGAVLLIGHDVVNAVALLYPLAAFLFALGISVLAIRSWAANTLPRWASALLIASTVVGILGFLLKGLAYSLSFLESSSVLALSELVSQYGCNQMKVCKVQAITKKQKHLANICSKRPQRLLE